MTPASSNVLIYFNPDGSVLLRSDFKDLPDGGRRYEYIAGTFFDDKPYTSFVDMVDGDGTITQHVETNADGTHVTEVDASHQVVQLLGGDTVADYASGTRFVFHHDAGAATIFGFQAAGLHHDVLVLPPSDADRLAGILAHATDDGQGDAMLHLGHGDTITLMGVSLAALHKHPDDVFTRGGATA